MIVEKVRELLTQENGEMNRIIGIKDYDKSHIIIHWRFPIVGFDALICPKNN